MKLLILNPYHSGSHPHWCDGILKHVPACSDTQAVAWTLPGRHWKWRMHGAAGAFARKAQDWNETPDVIMTTDMLDVAALRGLLPPHWRGLPIVQYFHENQLTYPWSSDDLQKQRGQDRSYGFMNIQSALAADELWFNSTFHMDLFLASVESFMDQLPDETEAFRAAALRSKSKVVRIGIDSEPHPAANRKMGSPPVILWNHRWEYDKGPDTFLECLLALQAAGIQFELLMCGVQFQHRPQAFDEILSTFAPSVRHVGYAESPEAYRKFLRNSDFIVHAPHQEYFGISVAEAMSCGVIPLLMHGQAYESWVPEVFLFRDNEQLVQSWHAALKDSSSFRRMAYDAVQSYFWEFTAPETARHLNRLASSHRGA